MIVFTDLDGTLLDHETYHFDAARQALAELAAHGVPLILASSKTAAEIRELRNRLDLDTPSIVENGGGIDWPASEPGGNGADDYAAIRARLAALPADLRKLFRGFGDMDSAEISALTGLGIKAAARAAARQFSEPGLFRGSGTERQAFLQHLRRAGLHAVQGGRFLTISHGTTKAQRMVEVRDALQKRLGRTLSPVVALGDAENDRAMLEASDIAVIIANPAHEPLAPLVDEQHKPVVRTDLPGPRGWNRSVLELLLDHGYTTGMRP